MKFLESAYNRNAGVGSRGVAALITVRMLHKEGAYKLGEWVSRQRQIKDTLTQVRRERLDDIGFVWRVIERTFKIQ